MIDINKYKAFIFDFDGVVMDTESLHFKAWNKGFSLLGDTLTEEEKQQFHATLRKLVLAWEEQENK